MKPGDRDVLLIVDVQNDFCHERGAMSRLGFDMGPIQSSVRALAQFVESARLGEQAAQFTARSCQFAAGQMSLTVATCASAPDSRTFILSLDLCSIDTNM